MEIKNLDEFKTKIRTDFTLLLDQHLQTIDRLFKPFRFDQLKPTIDKMFDDHCTYLSIHKESLSRLLDVNFNEKLDFADPTFNKIDVIDEYTKTNQQEPGNELVLAFLQQQRIMNTVSAEEFKKIQKTNNEILDFETNNVQCDIAVGQKIIALKFNSINEKLYAFVTNGSILVYDKMLILENTIKHPFGSIVSVDVFENQFIIANNCGNLFFAEGPDVVEKFMHHFSMLNKKAD